MKRSLMNLAAITVLAAFGGSAGAGNTRQMAASSLTAQNWLTACQNEDGWDAPGPPFRIHGNTWYVGTCGIAALLITGPRGHVLIDGGTVKGADVVAANIRRAGFRLKDVKLLLHSHEHFDHVGGIAQLQRQTGARLLAAPAARQVLATGRDGAGDPQFGMHPPFPAAKVAGTVADGEVVRLGPLAVAATATPGHTPGALSWRWQSCEPRGRDCRTVVYADSLNPISSDSYRFSDHPAYVADFRAGLAKLAALPCDILITPHPGASQMKERIAGAGLVDDKACAAFSRVIGERLDARLAKEGATRP